MWLSEVCGLPVGCNLPELSLTAVTSQSVVAANRSTLRWS